MPILGEIERNTNATTEQATSSKKTDPVTETADKTAAVVLEEEDVGFEENILRNPYSLRCWLRYIEHKKKCKAPLKQINMVYERALKELPGSYKLWYNYLRFRRKQISDKCPTDAAYQRLNNVYERALVFMHKMPRIWMDYCELMTQQRLITETRRVFDRALRALPVTQHERIWPLYIKFVTSHTIPETTIRVYRRYLKLMPKYREDFVEYLREIDRLDDAAQQLAILVNDDKLVSEHGKTTHQVGPVLQGYFLSKRYSDQVGVLWCALAEYYIRAALFEKARDVYEEAVVSVKTVRDFTQIFDAYARFTERATASKMDEMDADEVPDEDHQLELELLFARFEHLMDRRPLLLNSVLLRQNPHNAHEWLNRVQLYEGNKAKQVETYEEAVRTVQPKLQTGKLSNIWISFAKFEHLMDRRPLLLNSVLLRQNPHNAHEWLNRVQLYEGNKAKQVETYEEAVRTVQPKLQTGKLSNIWISFAKFYEREKQLNDARAIFEKGLEPAYCKVDDLATVWCEYAEFELRHREPERARKLMQRATAAPPRRSHYFDESEPVQYRVYKSLKVWSLYADIEEAFGTLESCQKVYERIIDLRIATPQIIINYAKFLEENEYFENSFKAYEKGIALFKWPVVNEIWTVYLTKFLKRYGGKKLERARDLFEQCLETCPPKFAMKLYLLYAKLEEEHGLPRHAMNIYNRATSAVEKQQMYSMFNIYIKKAASMYGLTHTRPIFQHAIEVLPEDRSREMGMRFAQMERSLGEIDRARAIYAHCSEICDPRVQTQFWETWKEFEVKHGNEDTVREMLRIKRSVQATYNTSVNVMSAQMLATAAAAEPGTAGDSMAVLEARAQKMAEEEGGTGAVKTAVSGANIRFVRGESNTAQMNVTENPDEINIDDNEDDEDEQMEQDIETREVPSGVLGSLTTEDNR
ncbi:Pre-mRNA-splicing factor syf-1 [Toxocara canis]|uniref:Pre-mRNA-splicing factor syf-1 n=1 Tax=Toxocara canis TaxID=6265 RepID=A0A0B2VIP7_TOXCA|nr:Pre-mRNA-splicing factor syf-1 [Toxocara canis]